MRTNNDSNTALELTFQCLRWLQTRRTVADWACSEYPPSLAHWGWPWHNLWSPTLYLQDQWEEPTSGRSGGLERQREKRSVSTAVVRSEYHTVKSTYTRLVVHGRYVNLEGSNVGQQEGQSPPVEHLRGRNITGVHLGHTLKYVTMATSWETIGKLIELTFISMTLSRKVCGASWKSNWKFWKNRKKLWWTLLQSTVFCSDLHSTVPRCRTDSWWISELQCVFSGFLRWWKLQGWCSLQPASGPRGCSHLPVRTHAHTQFKFMVFIVCNDRGLSDIQVCLLTLSKAHVSVKHKAQGRELAWQKDSNLAHWSVLDNVNIFYVWLINYEILWQISFTDYSSISLSCRQTLSFN